MTMNHQFGRPYPSSLLLFGLLTGVFLSPVVEVSPSFADDLNVTQLDTNASSATELEGIAQNQSPPVPSYPTLLPQIGGSFTSGPGAGTDRSSLSLEGFIPLGQVPGHHLSYLQGRFSLAPDGGHPGSNILFGYRGFNPKTGNILGGYIGLDLRETGRSSFTQLGLGLETLSPGWEARLNGYIPLGNRQQQIAESDTGLIISSPYFQGNNLFYNSERRITRAFDTSLAGFDLEAGAKLTGWNQGDLRAYLGTYYYGGPDVSTLGIRGRLAAKINENVHAGLMVQNDGEFGTSAVLTISVSFPGTRSRANTPEQQNWARMAEHPYRQTNIALTTKTKVEIGGSGPNTLAINPATGQPWFFQHVTAGASGGNGSFENPFSQVGDAVAKEGSIIYVQAGDGSTLNGFKIPDSMQVLSSGLPRIFSIPGGVLTVSAIGSLPNVGNTVTMGNNTVLSGFAIQPPSGKAGVLADGVQNVDIRDNRVETNGTDTAAVRLNNVMGSATVSNNTLASNGSTTTPLTGSHAVAVVLDGSSQTLANLNVTNNQVTIGSGGTNTNGIGVYSTNGGVLQAATISGNQVTTSAKGSSGIGLYPSQKGSITTATITDNTVTAAGSNAHGVALDPSSFKGSIGNATVSGNQITLSGSDAYGVYVSPSEDSSLGDATILGNTVTTSGSNSSGVYVNPTNGSSMGDATVVGNTVTTSGSSSKGVYINPNNGSSMGDVTVADNIVTTHKDDSQGIYVIANNAGQMASATISGNRATTSGKNSDGIELTFSEGASLTNVLVSNNTTTTAGVEAEGINLSLLNGGQVTNGTFSDNMIATSGSNAQGLYISVTSGAKLTNATISGNTMSTTGAESRGIDVAGNNGGTLSNSAVSNNAITTSGAKAEGINWLLSEGNQMTNGTISGNTIKTSGKESDAINWSLSNGASIKSATLSNNNITTAGNQAEGINSLVANGASITNATAIGNTITTGGEYAPGINWLLSNGAAITNVTATGNTITTAGLLAQGINWYQFPGTSLSNATISSNTIKTSGIDAAGIAWGGPSGNLIAEATFSSNTITTSGDNAQGIYLRIDDGGSSITNAVFDANTITTSGQFASGVSVNAYDGGSINNAIVANNTITTSGDNSNGIYTFLYSSGTPKSSINFLALVNNAIPQSGANNVQVLNQANTPICAAITNNLTQNPGLNSVNFLLQPVGAAFKVIGLNNLSVNNLGDNGGAIFSFSGSNTPTSDFSNVTSCP